MKRLISIALAAVIVATISVDMVYAQEEDLLGVFFDEAGEQSEFDTSGQAEVVPFYLVLLNPSRLEGIHSWECILEVRVGDEPVPVIGWEFAGDAVNADMPPRFLVSLATPLPSAAAVVLVTGEAFVVYPETEALFYLHSYNPPSLENPPGGGYPVTTPLYGYGDGNLQSLGWTSGCEAEPVARINDDGVDPIWSPIDIPSVIDFDPVPAGEMSWRYLVRDNDGDVAISGQIAISGEGFTYRHSGEEWTDERQWFRLEPGEELGLNLRVEAIMDDEQAGALELSMCGETATSVLVKPGYYSCIVDPPVLDFGEVNVYSPDPLTLTATVENTGGVDMSLTVEEDCPAFTVEPSCDLIPPGESCQLEVTLDPSGNGLQECIVSIGDGLCELMCTVVLVDSSMCEITPDSWDFGDVWNEQTVQKTVEVRNAGGQQLEGQVTIPESCSGFTLVSGGEPFSLAHDEIHAFTVEFSPAEPGPQQCYVFVSADCTEVELLAMGHFGPPQCVITPPGLDFGMVWIGEPAHQTFTVRNVGGSQLEGQVSIPDSCFAFTLLDGGEPFSLAHDEIHSFTIEFNPVESGPYECTVSVSTECEDIELIGSGVVLDVECWNYESGDGFIVGNLDTLGSVADVDVSGIYAYVVGEGRLYVVNIIDPYNPVVVGQTYDIHAFHVAVDGYHAYCLSRISGGGWPNYYIDYYLSIINLANPSVPVVESSLGVGHVGGPHMSGHHARELDASGDFVCILRSDLTLWVTPDMIVVDVSDPSDPEQIGSVEHSGFFQANEVVLSGEYAFINTSRNVHGGIWNLRASFVSLAEPSIPMIVGEWSGGGVEYAGSGIAVRENFLYLGGFCVLDVSEPTEPVLLGAVNMDTNCAKGFTVRGDFAYVTDEESGLQVIDISDPSSPVILGSLGTPGNAQNVSAGANCVCVADDGAGLQIALLQCEGVVSIEGDSEEPGEDEDVPVIAQPLSVHPNPFNPQATISFARVSDGWASVVVYDLLGRRVAIVANRNFDAGPHSLTWNGRDSCGRAMPSGTYIVRLSADSGVEARKVMLVR